MPGERAARTLTDMTASVQLDAAGRRRSPATMPGHHCGRPPRNKGLRYPADPPTVEELVAIMRCAGGTPYGLRTRTLIVLLWRAGSRISEALALAESDLHSATGGDAAPDISRHREAPQGRADGRRATTVGRRSRRR